MVEDVAVEQFDPLIAGGPDLRDRVADVAEGLVSQFADRRDADRVAPERAPAVGLISQSNVHDRSSH